MLNFIKYTGLMKCLAALFVMIALVLASVSKTKAQDVLTVKKMVVPDWVDVALGNSNQMEGGHHVYENWKAYLEGIKINTAKTGMLVSILNPDNDPATETPATYRLAKWTNTGAKPDSLGHASANSEWVQLLSNFVLLPDNMADAVNIRESSNNYININTGDGSEQLTFGNTVTNPDYTFDGTGTLTVSAGKLKVGTANANYITFGEKDLHVENNVEIGGNLYLEGNFHSPSDSRLKENIQVLTGVLEAIKQLRGVRYTYKDQQQYASGKQIGLIAQELQKVYPELVIKGLDGYLAVNYTNLTAVLVEAIKEQQQQINGQQQQIKDLYHKQEQQQKQLEIITQKLKQMVR